MGDNEESFSSSQESVLMDNLRDEYIRPGEKSPDFFRKKYAGFTLQDGCNIMGRDSPPGTGERYATRFFVTNRSAQRAAVTNEVLLSALLPCVLSKNRKEILTLVWSIVSTEIFIFFLHATVLTLGVTKIFVHTPKDHEILHVTHAILETILTCFYLIIQAAAAKESFHDIKRSRLKMEFMSVQGVSRSTAAKGWIFTFVWFTVLLCLADIGAFVAFYMLVHLGWTVYSSNVAILLSKFFATLTKERMDKMIAQIEIDQLKITLNEAGMLLNEIYCAQNHQDHQVALNNAERFFNSLQHTHQFKLPPYVTGPSKNRKQVIYHIESGV